MTGVNGQIITSETNKTKNEISETKDLKYISYDLLSGTS